MLERLSDVQGRMGTNLEAVAPSSDSPFYDIYQHVFDGSAKRIRPMFVYMTGEIAGIDPDQLDEYAVVKEMLHTASLMEDDWQDGSPRRRGKPAAHVQFGEHLTILSSIAIVIGANERLAGIDAKFELGGRLSTYVNRAFGKDGMSLGQEKDRELTGQDPSAVSIETLDEIAHLKTGLAIETSIVGAAMIGHLTPLQIIRLIDYSYHCGIAFQIRDDLLDAAPATDFPDKTPHRDEANSKPNYVSVLGSTEAAEAKLHHHREAAKAVLSHLSPDLNVTGFRQMIKYVAERDK
jgi:geranylgeranyl pyrophosphate synthase